MTSHNLAPAPGSTAPIGALRPGSLSPLRPVPRGIERPEYVLSLIHI